MDVDHSSTSLSDLAKRWTPAFAKARFVIFWTYAVAGIAIVVVLGLAALSSVGEWVGDSYLSGPPLIEVSMRQSALDSQSGVLLLTNVSGRDLAEVVVNGRNSDSGQSFKHLVPNIKPHEVVELGMLETGWKFIPNEEIQVLYEDKRFNEKRGYDDSYRNDLYQTYKADSGILGVRKTSSKAVSDIKALLERHDAKSAR